MRSLRHQILLFLAVFFIVCPRSAHAYLDPATGSMLVQILLGGLAGLAVLLKLFWHKLLRVLGFGKQDDNAPEN